MGLGHNSSGTSYNEQKTPTEITNSNVFGKIKSFYATYRSTFIKTTDGKLYGVGSNSSKELGLPNAGSVVNTFTEISFSQLQ